MKVVVIGSGSWGTALAQVLVDNHQDVILYGKNAQVIEEIQNYHKNTTFLPDVHLQTIYATTNFQCVRQADIIILCVPTIAIEDICKKMNKQLHKQIIIVNTSKGFHPTTNARMSDVIRSSFSSKHLKSVVSLIGPSHAEEVVLRMLTTICAISQDEKAAKTIQKLFSNEYFRVYRGNDEIGSEIGVALKNAIALASGILSGVGYGDNTKAALITRGLAEIIRYGQAMGGKRETFMGLTGIGDLIVTCTSPHSRNYQAGYEIGKHKSATYFWEHNKKTVEGVRTVKIVYEIAQSKGIDMPIVEEIYRVLYEEKNPIDSAKDLMLRDLKKEIS